MKQSDARWLLILTANLGYQVTEKEPWMDEPPGIIGRFRKKADAVEAMDKLPDPMTIPLFGEDDP